MARKEDTIVREGAIVSHDGIKKKVDVIDNMLNIVHLSWKDNEIVMTTCTSYTRLRNENVYGKPSKRKKPDGKTPYGGE